MALLVEEMGAGVLPHDDPLMALQLRHILAVRDMYRVVGTERQRDLGEVQWEMIAQLDVLAAESGS